jgi:hypothetical protein
MPALVLFLLLLGGCVRLDTLTNALEERQVQACVERVGFVMPFVFTHILIATGGATIEQCERLR